MRIALIGLGDIAQKAYLPVVANHPEVTPVLCTRNDEIRAQLACKYRIAEAYGSVDEAIAAGIDAAMVHASTGSHAELGERLLSAGIPTFIDKPLSDSLAASERLIELSLQHNVPLAVGFNRRFAPLIRPLMLVDNPVHVRWQKNRVDLAADARSFVFDDFIHVLDGLRFLAPSAELENLQLFARRTGDQLLAVHVSWQCRGVLLEGAMNRISGAAEERLEFFSENQKWQIDNLRKGWHYTRDHQHRLGFNDWHSTLYKRGFESMVQQWLERLARGGADRAELDDIRATHLLCEKVVEAISA